MIICVLSLAEADLLSGFRFYEEQCGGLGSYFLDTLYSEIESLRLYAGIHRKHGSYFRMLSRRFPYAVYYRISDEEVQIWRVLDCRRNPTWIQKQIEK